MKQSVFLFPAIILLTGCANANHSMIDDALIRTDPTPEAAAVRGAYASKGVRAGRKFRARSAAPTAESGTFQSDASNAGGSDFQAPAGRQMTYTTKLAINISDTAQGVAKAAAVAKKYQGYVVFSDNKTANIKIPVARADAALKDFETIGTVASKTITANDVTEVYTDTKVRLENLRRLQKRLAELLSRAVKVDEMLRIERELSRVTTDLERWQARMNVLSNQIEMVDFQISFNAIIKPTQIPRTVIPVKWVRELGVTICNENFAATGFTDDTPAEFALPEGFAVTHGTEYSFRAVNADNVVLKLTPFNNLPSADLVFYQKLIEKQLKYAGYNAVEFKKGKTATSDTEYLAVTALSGQNRLAIMIAIHDTGWICKDEKVFVFELFGPADAIKKVDLEKLYTSLDF